jgi:hypothetical protein
MQIETDYYKARMLFEQAAEKAGLRVFHMRVPFENTPELFIDFALAKRDPEQALVCLSGTHGIEGYAGSQIQRDILKDLPQSGPSLLFVHAVNPYGMAFYRRANGNNVDLNRSYNLGPIENADYKYFDSYLNPKSGFEFISGTLRAALSRLQIGELRTRQAVASGQMDFPDGIFYAGREIQREVKLIQEILRTHLRGTRNLTTIDLHTGLGDWGGEMLFVDDDRESDSAAYFEKVFGRSCSASDASEGAYSIHGRISDAFRAALPDAKMRYCLQEFGTYPNGKVLNALRKENFEWRDRPKGAMPSEKVRHAMLEAFLPEDREWREKIVGLGVKRWKQAWDAMVSDTFH